MGVAASSSISWHDVRDMSPPELADLMVRTFDPSFGKHQRAIIDHAVGGGIVCSLGEQSLRTFLADISITLKPQQDIIIQALDELRRSTDAAVTALEESGSPYKHAVVRNLRTHHAAYVTFTKEGETFRGATKFAKSLRQTIDSAWDPPNVPVTVRLRGSATFGNTHGPLLHEVAKSLNLLWLLSAGSLQDPFCLMEVCAAVRQGTPVIPVRLAGAGIRPLNLPIWPLSIAVKSSQSTAAVTAVVADADAKPSDNRTSPTDDSFSNVNSCDRNTSGGDADSVEHGFAEVGGSDDANTAAETRQRARCSRRRAADKFYVHLAQRLPKSVQAELHRNSFTVKDVLAAVRVCFENEEESGRDTELVPDAATGTQSVEAVAAASNPKPPVFDPSARSAHHEKVLKVLVGVNCRTMGERGVAEVVGHQGGRQLSSPWNWEQVPRVAPMAGRARVNDAVPWRSDEEITEMIKMENAEADDLAGLLVKDMLTHPGSENHQWEGCKGLSDLAARDSDGLSAVRRQGGIQAVLAALKACPKDADVQRWGCQALVPLFSDPVVAAPFRQAGVAAVIRALAVLQDVEAALESMGAVARLVRGGGFGGIGRPKRTAARERWTRAMRKIEVGRVKEQRRASLERKEVAVQKLEKEEAELATKIAAHCDSLARELEHEIETEDAVELAAAATAAAAAAAAAASAAEAALTASGSATDPDGEESLPVEEDLAEAGTERESRSDQMKKVDGVKAVEVPISSFTSKTAEKGGGETRAGETDDGGNSENEARDALAEEQQRLEELDRAEHEAEMARLKKLREEAKPDPWAMTDADIAVYDKAFIKQDKDKDGFITLREARPMFDKARASKEARRDIWKLADPYQRGKLTQHGWRVAYHLARSMKSRKLELPETLPQCLHPPGFVPVVVPLPVEDEHGVKTEKGQTKPGAGGVKNKDSKASVGGVGTVAVKDGGAAAAGCVGETAAGKDNRKGKAAGGGVRAADEVKSKDKGAGGGAQGRKGKECGSAPRKKKEDNAAKNTKKKKKQPAGEKGAATAVVAAKEDRADETEGYRMSDEHKARYAKMFDKFTEGKPSETIGGREAAAILAKSGLKKSDLGRLWAMADADRDGGLSRHEFAVAMHLAARRKAGLPLPSALPPCLAGGPAAAAAEQGSGDEGGEEEEAVGDVIAVDDGVSTMSSLGGFSEDSERGGVVAGIENNSPESEQGRKVSRQKKLISTGSGAGAGAGAPKQRTSIPPDGIDPELTRGQRGQKKPAAAAAAAAATTKGEREEGEGEGGEQEEEESGVGKRKDGVDSEYGMSDQDISRYGKTFDKLVKGKGIASLGGQEAAAVLAKSGLGKTELGRLWVVSDVDRDGALSRMEFSIAMHLASCSASKNLPVPGALPESLAALLPPGGNRAKAAAARRGAAKEGGDNGESDPRKRPTSAGASAKGEKARKKTAAGDKAGRKKKETSVSGTGGSVEGAGGGKEGSKRGAHKLGSARGTNGGGRGGQTGGAAEVAENGTRPPKKRGFGMLSSCPGAAEAKKNPSTAAEKDKAASSPASSPAGASGDRKKKRPKKAGSGDEQKDKQNEKGGNVATGRREPLFADKKAAEAEPKRSATKSSKSGAKNGTSAKRAAAAAAAAAAGAREGVTAGKAGSAESLAREGNGAGNGTEEDGGSDAEHGSAGERDGDGDGDGDDDGAYFDGDDGDAGAETGDAPAEKKAVEKTVEIKKRRKPLSNEERDQLYAMTISERAGYDIVFMQIDADHSGTVDGREAAALLSKSGLTRQQLSAVWGLADSRDIGELNHDEWAIAMHLARCVAQKHLPLPDTLPRSMGGPDLVGSPGGDGGESEGQQSKGSKARREAEQARELGKQMRAGRAVRLREETLAFRLGKITAAAFYITLAGAFGAKRHTMIPKVARSLPLDKARALVAAAGLPEGILQDNEVAEARLQQLRRRRLDQVNLHVKSTTSGATARDVQLLACRLGNCLCASLDAEGGGGGVGGMAGRMKGEPAGGDSDLGGKTTVAVEIASAGGVNAVALIFRMFEASDLELMVEALQFALVLACACAAAMPDDSASKPTSLESSPQALVAADEATGSSQLLSLLRPLYAPSACKKVAEVAKQFPHSRKSQRLCCMLVGQLGSSCGAPARRCFADCCEPVVAAAAGGLDEHAASDSDGSSTYSRGGDNELQKGFSSVGQGVREVACQALATLVEEPGLSRRLVAAGAGQAATHAMGAAPRNYDVQLACLETIAMLAESNPRMWDDDDSEARKGGGGGGHGGLSIVIDTPCRRAVQSIQTFVRDPNIHRAASRTILVLLIGDATGNAARSVAAAGGATALSKVLAASPHAGDVQLPAVLAINELLEAFGRMSSGSSNSSSSSAEVVPVPVIEPGDQGPTTAAVAAAAESVPPAPATAQTVESELLAAAGCELLCKSVKAFPRDRDLRLGCLRAMGAMCRGARRAAVDRLVAAGACQQLMKVVEAYPGDMEVRRAGLALLIGIAEHGDGTSDFAEDDRSLSSGASCATAGALVNRLGLVGAVGFAAAWLREVTAPAWAWVGTGYGDSNDDAPDRRARDLMMSCKAVLLLTRNSSSNRDRLASMGAIEALSRAVALSGRRNGHEDTVGSAVAAEEGSVLPAGEQQQEPLVSVQAKAQVWAAQALAELAGGHENESRCSALVRHGALRALFAAMNKTNSPWQLQRAGCMALGEVAACLNPCQLQALGRNGGAQAVTGAFKLCPGDKDVALAGLLAVAKLSGSAENRRLLGEAGVCPMIAKELLEFSDREAVAEEGCRAITRLAALSGFNRTALGHAGAAEATAAALRNHPSRLMVQRWGLSASAALVAEMDPSGNTARIVRVGILDLVAQALGKFRHSPVVQAEGLKTFAKVADSGESGADAVWNAGVVLLTVRALGLYVNDANVQHWGMVTVRVFTGADEKCEVWRGVGAPEAVVRTLTAFGRDGPGRLVRHGGDRLDRAREARRCTADESLCIQFQACAAAFNLARSSPDGRRRMVGEGAGEALAKMMTDNFSNSTAQQGALAALAALSASGVDNRKRLHRYKGGVPRAVVAALEAFPEDRRVRCEGVLTVQNLSFTTGGARAMAKAGVAPVMIRLLRNALLEAQLAAATAAAADETGVEGSARQESKTADGEHLDRDVLVHVLNGLANMATAKKSLSDFVGRHGACQAVVSALEQHPKDLQLQASGVKAVRALALGGGRNVEVLADVRGPAAIARAQGLFLRDREVQLACLGAAETLCRGGNRASRKALMDAGSLSLLESALTQFRSDAEVVSQGLRALVEIVLCGDGGGGVTAAGPGQQQEQQSSYAETAAEAAVPPAGEGGDGDGGDDDDAGKQEEKRRYGNSNAVVEESLSSSTSSPSWVRYSSLPRLRKRVGDEATLSSSAAKAAAPKLPPQPRPSEDIAAVAGVPRAVGTVLSVLELDPHRDVCLSAFDALLRLLVTLGTSGSDLAGDVGSADGSADQQMYKDQGKKSSAGSAGGLLRLAQVRYAVKRALKINRSDDAALASRGGKILTLIAVARGRALAQ